MEPPFYNNADEYKKRRKPMQNWIDKIHPVRAALAVISLLSTIYMLIAGLQIPDAWWIIVTALALFYVEAIKSNPNS